MESVIAERPAVRCIAWLDFGTWLSNKLIIVCAIAVDCLTAADRTALNVTAVDVNLAFSNAAIVAGLAICSPVVLLAAISHALIHAAADAECFGDRVFCHGVEESNENKMSCHERERAWQRVKGK